MYAHNNKVARDEMENPVLLCTMLERGYTFSDYKYQAGYVTRRGNINYSLVYVASGKRKNEFYFLAPCKHSTRYCYRVYLTKGGKN